MRLPALSHIVATANSLAIIKLMTQHHGFSRSSSDPVYGLGSCSRYLSADSYAGAEPCRLIQCALHGAWQTGLLEAAAPCCWDPGEPMLVMLAIVLYSVLHWPQAWHVSELEQDSSAAA